MNYHLQGKYLTYKNRIYIQTLLKEGYYFRAITRILNYSASTISYEVYCYKTATTQENYSTHRLNSGRKYKYLTHKSFIDYTEKHLFNDKWFPDAVHGRALSISEYTSEQVVSIRALYNYVDNDLLKIKNHDFPEKLSRNTLS